MQSMTTLNIQRRTENRGLYEYRLVFKWADGVALETYLDPHIY